MRKRIATVLVGGALAVATTVSLAGAASAAGVLDLGSTPNLYACDRAGQEALHSPQYAPEYNAYRCVPNGGAPTEGSTYELYLDPIFPS